MKNESQNFTVALCCSLMTATLLVYFAYEFTLGGAKSWPLEERIVPLIISGVGLAGLITIWIQELTKKN